MPNEEDNKFEVAALKESLNNVAIKIVNNAENAEKLKELRLNVGDDAALKPEVGQEVQLRQQLDNSDGTKRNKWIVTKHHVGKKDWFTLKNEAYGYFLTCRPKDKQQPIVSYEVPGIPQLLLALELDRSL